MTSRQQDALEFIRANQRVVTIGPSLRELAGALGIAANAAQQKVEFLRREGIVAPNTGQGIVLASGAVEPAAPAKKRPVKLDDIIARKPILRPSGRI